jgi:hypothetical protein
MMSSSSRTSTLARIDPGLLAKMTHLGCSVS